MKILAIGAHPDDIEIGCGGTLGKYIDQGDNVEVLVMTAGEAGSISIDKSELAVMREKEAVAGAKVLGIDKVHFFGLEDGLTGFSRSEKVKLIALLRDIRPDIIFLHSESDNSYDHQMVHKLALAAIFSASGPWFGEAGSAKPYAVKSIYGYEVWSPLSRFQMAVSLTEDQMKRKIEALKKHKSQVDSYDYVKAVEGLAKYRGVMSGAGEFAEVFEVIKIS